MRPTVVIVVDTLTYDESLMMSKLMNRGCEVYTWFWGVAPFTLPAMATIVSGLLPDAHGCWKDRSDPRKARRNSKIKTTMADDFEKSFAATGPGFADGNAWGFSHGFLEWKIVGTHPNLAEQVQDEGLSLLHTYELHDYIFENGQNKAEERVHQKPWTGISVRGQRLRRVEGKILALLKAYPKHDVWVTSDHGEGCAPPHAAGHSADCPPSERLLHLPLVKFGPDIRPCLHPEFRTQDQLRDMVAGRDPVLRDKQPVVWRWNREEKPFVRYFELPLINLEPVQLRSGPDV